MPGQISSDLQPESRSTRITTLEPTGLVTLLDVVGQFHNNQISYTVLKGQCTQNENVICHLLVTLVSLVITPIQFCVSAIHIYSVSTKNKSMDVNESFK